VSKFLCKFTSGFAKASVGTPGRPNGWFTDLPLRANSGQHGTAIVTNHAAAKIGSMVDVFSTSDKESCTMVFASFYKSSGNIL
jgi:hypothetical protein